MIIGIPKEQPGERRVALTPAGVKTLVRAGHTVMVESDAGTPSGISDKEFVEAGGQIVFSHEEAIRRVDFLLKVGAPTDAEYDMLNRDQIVFSFFHLAVADKLHVEKLMQKHIAAVGLETIETETRRLPVLHTMSEIAGQLSIMVAAQLLECNSGGRGILLGGLPGVPAASVVILGGGVVGHHAAQTALGLGAQVLLMDADLEKLQTIDRLFSKKITTIIANEYNIAKALQFADVVIGAVLIHGAKTPKLITESMVKTMKTGAVIIDVSIDQGGCVETSRPTNPKDPFFVKHGVIHYCVPNMASSVARTATFALNNVLLPYILEVAGSGVDTVEKINPAIRRGLYTFQGKCLHPKIVELFELK
ncbi:alanine dehydrogenase [bacterium]|nr:alanine dehydrogenase [bacterium]